MLHLGGPAVLFLLCAPATLCRGRVWCGAGSCLNRCLLVPCPKSPSGLRQASPPA